MKRGSPLLSLYHALIYLDLQQQAEAAEQKHRRTDGRTEQKRKPSSSQNHFRRSCARARAIFFAVKCSTF
jgi:hypothetical protein